MWPGTKASGLGPVFGEARALRRARETQDEAESFAADLAVIVIHPEDRDTRDIARQVWAAVEAGNLVRPAPKIVIET